MLGKTYDNNSLFFRKPTFADKTNYEVRQLKISFMVQNSFFLKSSKDTFFVLLS